MLNRPSTLQCVIVIFVFYSQEPPPQVPYSLAIHLSQQFVGNSENKDVLQQQVNCAYKLISNQLSHTYNLMYIVHVYKAMKSTDY